MDQIDWLKGRCDSYSTLGHTTNMFSFYTSTEHRIDNLKKNLSNFINLYL